MKLTISRESVGLFLVCLVDALLTVVFVATGQAAEANPLMAHCLEYGCAAFLAFKMVTVFMVIVAAEMYRRHNPLFVRRLMQGTITAYVGIYLTLLLAVNSA